MTQQTIAEARNALDAEIEKELKRRAARAKRRREPLERGIREWRRKCAREDMRR